MKRLSGFALAGVLTLAALFSLGPAQAFAAQVSCGQVITQDTRVDNDLIDCPGDGLVIGADGVTLDLNGHTIDGVGAGNGIVAGEQEYEGSGPDAIRVRNGRIQQFKNAVELNYADGAHLEELTSYSRIFVFRSQDVVIERVYLRGASVGVNGGPITITDSRLRDGSLALDRAGGLILRNRIVNGTIVGGGRIQGNTIVAPSGRTGIKVPDAAGGTLLDNRISGGAVGIETSHPFGGLHQIKRNVVSDNSKIGIYVYDSDSKAVIEENVVSGNGDGISLIHQNATNVVAGNRVYRNRANGIYAEPGGTITGNLVYDNGNDGIAGGNEVVGNRVSSNGGNGISVDFGRLVQGNVSARNGLDGILIGSSFRGEVVDNTVFRNGDDGIDVETSVGSFGQSPLVWAPGQKIVYLLDGEVYTLNPDGTERVRVSNGQGQVAAPPLVSPDGTRLLFWGIGGYGGLYVATEDGSDLQLLSPATTGQAWAPDGSRIAFTEPTAVFTVNADGTERRQIASSAYGLSAPVWSPDGKQIAFAGLFGGDAKVFVVNADGTGLRVLTVPPSWAATSTAPVALGWRDAGEVLAVHENELFGIRADGSGFRTIDSDVLKNVVLGAFALSPDGTRVTFSRYRGDGHFDVYTINLDGTNERRLAEGSNPQWSPDGSRIVYLAPVEAGGSEIAIMTADGAPITRLHEAHVTIARNRAYRSGDLGIEAPPIVNDNGGNRAWANGNPLQCLNVVCK